VYFEGFLLSVFFLQVKRGEAYHDQIIYKSLIFKHLLSLVAVHVPERINAIVNRLNKTKEERVVDHEQERTDRIKAESAVRRAAATEKVCNERTPPLIRSGSTVPPWLLFSIFQPLY